MSEYTHRTLRPKLKHILLSSVATLVAGGIATAATADELAKTDGSDKTSKTVDELVVTGYRKSLGEARVIKKDSVIQKDVIIAEDMAKFPELNLAESLQRLPGVQINREAGEGRRISLRGLGPDFARVQLNGMEVLGNVDSAQDSRGQRSRDRAFDFNIFASELFSKVEVEKTFQAAQNEGGMGGTVGLFTARPFDYAEGVKGAAVVKLGTNQYTKDTQPRIAALFSRNWDDKFGIALSVAYGKRETTEQGHNTYNYSDFTGSDIQSLIGKGLDISNLSASLRSKLVDPNQTFYFADGNRISSWNAKQERLGITASVQWRPMDDMLLTLDALHGEFTTHRDELHLATRPLNGGGSTTLGGAANSSWPLAFRSGTILKNVVFDANNYAVRTEADHVIFGSEHRRELNENRFNQIGLTGEWKISDRLKIDGHVGYSKSTYKTPYDDKLYMRAVGNLIADYGSDGRSAAFSYPNWSPKDPANWAMDNFYYRGFDNSSKLSEGVLNGRYTLSDSWTLRAGVAYHKFDQEGIDLFYDGGANGTTAKTRGTSVADITTVFSNQFGSWLIGDYNKAFAKYKEYHRFSPNKIDGSGGALQDIENVYNTSEKTVSEYIQADWDDEVFGKRFRGNIGLRGYQTDTHSSGWIQGDSYAYLGTTDVNGHYSGVLPALNTVFEFTPEVLLRFSATRNLNRPTIGSMAARGSAFQNEDSGKISASRGNPDLLPFKDDTFDLALEYYFGEVGLLSASVYQKTITNFIGSVSYTNDGAGHDNRLTFAQAGVPYQTIPGATANTKIDEFSMPVNVSGHIKLTGVEFAGQAQFTFLPAPFDNFGAVANYSHVDAPSITGISKNSYNVTLYYETDVWTARISASHRTRWFTGYSKDLMSADTRGFEGSTYVDAAASWNINQKLQVTLDAINLTNQKDTQFWGQSRYLYNQNQSGSTYMLGLRYNF